MSQKRDSVAIFWITLGLKGTVSKKTWRIYLIFSNSFRTKLGCSEIQNFGVEYITFLVSYLSVQVAIMNVFNISLSNIIWCKSLFLSENGDTTISIMSTIMSTTKVVH